MGSERSIIPRWLKSSRVGAREKESNQRPPETQIIVTAFCQTAGIGAVLSTVFPNAAVHLQPIINSKTNARKFKALLEESDIWVICESEDSQSWSEYAKSSLPNLTYLRVPLVTFPGFHPDLCTAFDYHSGVTARQKYSSRIGVWAYKKELPAIEAEKYFTSEVFARLGYFSHWNDSTEIMQREFQNSDLADDFSRYYRRVKRLGQFMHTQTHPTADAITTLGKLVAMKLGATADVFDQRLQLADTLAYLRWPLYPEIAFQLSLPTTGYVWKMQQSTLDEDIVIEGVQPFLSYCFNHYRHQGIKPQNIGIKGVDMDELDRTITA